MELAEAELEPVLEHSRPYGPEESCDYNPEFAVICSFIQQFGDRIELELDIEQLKRGLENQESLDDYLIETHVKLLRKLRRYFVRDQWEKALIRFAYEYSYKDGREIETQGFVKARPSIKMQLLRRLLDAQFECDQKFKAVVNTDEADKLRNQPLGRDIRGNIYWHCQDKEGHFRVFSEDPMNHRSWKVSCQNPDELDNLIDELDRTKDDRVKGQPQTEPYNPYPEIFPEYFIKSEEESETRQEENESSSKKTAKKGRRGRPTKKPTPQPPPPREVEDMKPVLDDVKPYPSIKLETVFENNDLAIKTDVKEEALNSINADQSDHANSIESQVKQTLENLINRVTSSFDFFFRRNSVDSVKKEAEPVANKRKRNSRRDKLMSEELPRRSSSRIQQLQQRKITEFVEKQAADQKPLELEIKKPKTTNGEDLKTNNCSKSRKNGKKEKQRWRTKGKKKLSWDKDDSDLSSTSSLTDSNDESFVEQLNVALDTEAVRDSDEFACEEEETNDAPVILKRARTARQVIDTEEDGQLNGSSIVEEDKPCGRCDKSNDPDWILLCDMCDDGYHTACCIPPLMFVPDGDWYCLPCEHKTLLSKLRDISSSVKEILAEKERERQKRQKLRQAFRKTAVKPEHDEIVPERIAPERRGRAVLPELNPPIAVQDLDEILGESSGQELSDSYRERAYRRPKKKTKSRPKQARRKRRKRYISDEDEDEDDFYFERPSKSHNRRFVVDTESEDEDEDEIGNLSSEVSDDGSQPKARRARACVNYQFKEYDELIKSAIQADSDDPASPDEDSPAEEQGNYGRGKDMATIEALAYQQENGINGQELKIESADIGPKESTKSRKARKKGRRLNDLDVESEIDIATSDDSFQAASDTEEEEEEEDDDLTELDSEEDSSIDEIVNVNPKLKARPRRARREKPNRNYYESDDSSDFEPPARRDDTPSPNPPFYREDEVRPATTPTSNNIQESW